MPRAATLPRLPPEAVECRRKFLRFFAGGFRDETYIDWERGYKWTAHEQWQRALGRHELRSLVSGGKVAEVAARAVRVESRTNLLFSFEKMALRDAVRSLDGARLFAEGLHEFLHGAGSSQKRFEDWCATLAELPRKQTRVLTWPLATVFGFIARPDEHIFVKPRVTQVAAAEYGFDLHYVSRPNWDTYQEVLDFAEIIRRDQRDLAPRDMIDLQSFMWVQGSDEYEE